MKRKKQHAKSLVFMLALTLTLSVGAVFPRLGTEDNGAAPPLPKSPPVEKEIPEIDVGDDIRPLSDKDDLTTKVMSGKKFLL